MELPKITVADAVAQLKKQAETDGKSNDRQKQLAAALDAFSDAFNWEVHQITPKVIADYLTALPFRERTRRNHRDVIGFFNRWLVLHGYLAKATDWLEGVQNYTARKLGEISIYTAEEMRRLIAAADERILPLIVIGGFAGLRHAEIVRLDWQDIDLEDGFIEVQAQHAKTETRRIVPIKPNLKSFLQPMAKEHGKVVSVVNTTKFLLQAAADTTDKEKEIPALEWKQTQRTSTHLHFSPELRSLATYRGWRTRPATALQVIRTNYLKRIARRRRQSGFQSSSKINWQWALQRRIRLDRGAAEGQYQFIGSKNRASLKI